MAAGLRWVVGPDWIGFWFLGRWRLTGYLSLGRFEIILVWWWVVGTIKYGSLDGVFVVAID